MPTLNGCGVLMRKQKNGFEQEEEAGGSGNRRERSPTSEEYTSRLIVL